MAQVSPSIDKGVEPAQAPVLLPEHRFASSVTGPAYRSSTKLMTLAVVLAIIIYGAIVLNRREVAIANSALWLMAGAAAVMLVTCYYVLVGKTTVDAKGIRQDWYFQKDYRWHEISRARFVRLPFSARLLVFVGGGPMKAINSGSQALDEAMKAIADFYSGRSS